MFEALNRQNTCCERSATLDYFIKKILDGIYFIKIEGLMYMLHKTLQFIFYLNKNPPVYFSHQITACEPCRRARGGALQPVHRLAPSPPAGLAAELGRPAPSRSRPPPPRLHQKGCRRKPAYRVSLKPSRCGRKPRCGAVAVSVMLLSPPE